jgi:hypothetical protein
MAFFCEIRSATDTVLTRTSGFSDRGGHYESGTRRRQETAGGSETTISGPILSVQFEFVTLKLTAGQKPRLSPNCH